MVRARADDVTRAGKGDSASAMNSKSKTRIWPWVLLALLWCVAMLNYLDRQVIFSIFPLLQRDLHASSVQLGLASTLFLMTYGAASPFAGYAADRFGHARMILLSLAIWSVASFLAGIAPTMPMLLGTRAVMGLSEAFYIPAALGLLVKVHEERFRSLATGIHQTGCYAGIIGGGIFGGLAATVYSWRSLFMMLGSVGVIYAVVLLISLRGPREQHDEPVERPSLPPLLQNQSVLLYIVVFVVFSIATWMLYTWLPLYLYEHFGMSLIQAGFEATFWLQCTSFGGAFLGGALADRLQVRVPTARILVQAGGLAIACPFLILLSHTNSQTVVILALITIGLGRGCFDANTAPILAQIVGTERCATAYGLLNCAGCLVAGITTLGGGWMRQNVSFSMIFAGAGLTLLGGIACLAWLAREAGAGSTTTF